MKTVYTFAFLFLILSIGIKAQMPILLSKDSVKIGKNSLPGLTVTIPEANYEKTLKAWVKSLESGTKSNVVTEKDEMSIFGANLKNVSPNPVNLYSKLISYDSILKLSVVVELSKDNYIEQATNGEGYAKVQDYLKEFSKNRYIEVASDQLDAEEKILKDFEKELESLAKEKTRLQKSIQSNNTKIISENDNITIQNNELKTVTASIVDNNSQLGSMDDGPAKEERSKYIKELEKRKKKALSSIESSQNKINNANNDIDEANLEIPKNEVKQEDVRKRIAQQEMVVQKFTDKLEKIKSY
jgi:peptidoglycan hydrolase CwlO-like protein